MIDNNKYDNEKTKIQQSLQQPQNQVFESVSESSELQEQQASLNKLSYTLAPIEFPSPEPNTLKLLGIYQQNSELIHQLKSQISRLSDIKKENLFIKHDCAKISFQQQDSEFFLRSKELYNQRQQELQKIKKEIKAIDQQKLTTLMSKNQNILNLAQIYFSKFRTIIDARVNGQQLVLLTEQKKKIHHKKKKRSQEDDLMDKLPKNNSRIRSQIKKSEQKISNIVKDIKKNEQQQSDNDSKISTPRKREHEKFNSNKRTFNIRFVSLNQLFPEFQQSQDKREGHLFRIGLKTDCVPRQIVYDSNKKLILILFSTNVIYAYCLSSDSQEQVKDQHSDSHKIRIQGHNGLRQLSDFRIQIDMNVRVVLFQLRDCQIYLGTSDGILRVYQIDYEMDLREISYQIKSIVFLLNCDQSLVGQIELMCLSNVSKDEIFFIDNKKLCRMTLNKYKTQIVHRFDQKVVSLSESVIETQQNVMFKYSQGNILPVSKQKIGYFSGREILKVCSFVKNECMYFIRVEKHGLLSGLSVECKR